jgi:hypothetical protein
MAGKTITEKSAMGMYKRYIQRPDNVKIIGKKLDPLTDRNFYFLYDAYVDTLLKNGYKIK